MSYTCDTKKADKLCCKNVCGIYISNKDVYCNECGKLLKCDEIYDDRFHSALCIDCLKMLHKL